MTSRGKGKRRETLPDCARCVGQGLPVSPHLAGWAFDRWLGGCLQAGRRWFM